jgi:molybdopterin molybdotransferase
MAVVPTMHFDEARKCVVAHASGALRGRRVERIPLEDAAGRVLACDVAADRDYPPAARSIRDGFAIRAADFPGRAHIIGELRAGEIGDLRVGPGEAVEIMTGAPLPAGADAVVMAELTSRDGQCVISDRTAKPGEFVNPKGAECKAGEPVLRMGTVVDYTCVAMLATFGWTTVPVFARPRVAILATGDEIVAIADSPADYQIRNSNSYSLATQVRRAGGCPEILPVARDNADSTRDLIGYGLTFDLLLLSGGVSAGKYDLVEDVLREFGAEIYFDRVLIQPGQPLVFGRAGEKFFFGLPGNPASTMVTFELFGRAALELIAGRGETLLPITRAPLTAEFRHKTGLTRFLPARLDDRGLTPIQWAGSSDVPSLTRANAYLVADHDRESWAAGDLIGIMPK